MKTLYTRQNIGWAPQPNTVEWVMSETLPPLEACSSAYVFAFQGDKLLMADLDRGVDIVGGHIDAGEMPEQAMRREAVEETGAIIGAARLIGYQKITLHGEKPEGYKYPYPVSYQVMYLSTDFALGEFTGDEDSKGAVLIAPQEAQNVPWLQRNQVVYDYARSLLSPQAAPACRMDRKL